MAHEEDEWSCSICYQLLLDPVVGKCGHDFCKSCLLSWASAQGGASGVVCPLCRTELAPDGIEGIKKLGVCVRIKRMLESLMPDKVAARRQERGQEEARAVTAQRAAAQQHIRMGRTRFLRARRTRHVSSSAPLSIPPTPPTFSPDISAPHSPPASAGAFHAAGHIPHTPPHLQLLPNSYRLRLMGTADLLQATNEILRANHPNHPAGGSGAMDMATPAGAGGPGQGFAWQAPATINFNMGWWEPSKEERRKRVQYRNRLALLASATASVPQQAGYVN